MRRRIEVSCAIGTFERYFQSSPRDLAMVLKIYRAISRALGKGETVLAGFGAGVMFIDVTYPISSGREDDFFESLMSDLEISRQKWSAGKGNQLSHAPAVISVNGEKRQFLNTATPCMRADEAVTEQHLWVPVLAQGMLIVKGRQVFWLEGDATPVDLHHVGVGQIQQVMLVNGCSNGEQKDSANDDLLGFDGFST